MTAPPASPRPSPLAQYSPTEHRPLAGYATLVAAYGAVLAGTVAAARATGCQLPDRVGAADVAIIGVATHKLSRLVAKDKVTSFLRAPFTRFEGETGQGEVSEQPRGRGIQMAVGELILCPYCLAHWVATGFVAGLVFAPRGTRLVAATYTAEAVADFLQLAYHAAEERS